MELKNKSICVTGGLGFIGSHFVQLLLNVCSDCSIDIVDSFDYCVSEKTEKLLRSIDSSNNVKIIHKDISLYLPESHCDFIVNFAAQSHVDNSIDDPASFVDCNYYGFFTLLDNMSKSTRFLQVSTDEVYGSCYSALEDHALNPSSVYSSTKAGADILGLSMHKTNGLDFLITRSCNNFGPRQFDEKFIPVILRNILTHKSIPIYGDGKNKRQWVYVKENCQQILGVMLYGESGEVYNVTPYEKDNIFSNLDLVDLFIDASNCSNKNIKQFVKDRQAHDFCYSMSGDKTKKLLKDNDFQVEMCKFEDAIDLTVDWYKHNLDWFSY
jgi:dTDP-glucose 4,6-dehydratase